MSMRWAVAVNTTTGQHTLLRRYGARDFEGELNDIYQSEGQLQGRDFLTAVKLSETMAPPSVQELTAAVAAVEQAREELQVAAIDFKRQIREALARNGALLAAHNRFGLDDELANDVRENLFAIRGLLAGVTTVLGPEDKVRRAVERADRSVRELEALTAFVNANTLGREGPTKDSRALVKAQTQSDTEIRAIRSLEREAIAALPPDLPMPEAQLPALRKDMIAIARASSRSRGRETLRTIVGCLPFGPLTCVPADTFAEFQHSTYVDPADTGA